MVRWSDESSDWFILLLSLLPLLSRGGLPRPLPKTTEKHCQGIFLLPSGTLQPQVFKETIIFLLIINSLHSEDYYFLLIINSLHSEDYYFLLIINSLHSGDYYFLFIINSLHSEDYYFLFIINSLHWLTATAINEYLHSTKFQKTQRCKRFNLMISSVEDPLMKLLGSKHQNVRISESFCAT